MAGAPAWLGITRLGQGMSQGNGRFSVPVGGCVKHGLFYMSLDLTSLGLGTVKQLKGLTLASWFPLAKPL